MSQWLSLNQLCRKNRQVQERVNEHFNRINFPYKIRSTFAEWIEGKEWNSIDVQSDIGKSKAMCLFKELMMMIESHELNMQQVEFDLDKTLDIKKARDTLKMAFEGNYCTFVEVVRQCLQAEQILISTCQENDSELRRKNKLPDVATENAQVNQKLAVLLQHFTMAEASVQDVSCKQEEFCLEYPEKMERLQQLQVDSSPEISRRKADMEKEIGKQVEENFSRRNAMVDQIVLLANGLNEVLRMIWREIEIWQNDQKKMIAALSKPKDGALDILDKMCDEAGNLLIKTIQLLNTAFENIFKKLEYQGSDKKREDLEKILSIFKKDILPEHLQRIFIVERNIPDRVLKVNGGKSLGFSMSLRILGGNNLGMNYNQPKVTMSLFQEKDIPQSNEYKDGACRIENGQERTFSVNRGNNACVAHFHSVMLRNVRRPDRGKNEELVTEHKYAFVFYTVVSILNETYKLKVISLPVILTSQTSQEIMAKGTLIWDAAFSDEVRKPFEYRESVTWGEFAKVLNSLFLQNTGRGLNSEHLTYLAKMAFRHREPKKPTGAAHPIDFDKKMITYNQAIRDRLASKEYSFWKWVYCCMNLVNHHVKKEWQDGNIFGFISKDGAKKRLANQPTGTFLLRFSESNIEPSQKSDICGFLTLAVMEIDPETGKIKLFHVKDYLAPKEIQEKGLAPILDAMEVADYANPKQKVPLLRYQWREDKVAKFSDIFGPYIQERVTSSGGYKRGKFSIEIFLSDDQIRGRNRQDSVDGSTDYGPGSVQSSTSIDSVAISEVSPPSNEYDLAMRMSTWGDEQYPTSSNLVVPGIQERPMAQVPPTVYPGYQQNLNYPSNFPNPDTFGDMMQYLTTADDDALFEQILRPDADGDLIIASSSTAYNLSHQMQCGDQENFYQQQ